MPEHMKKHDNESKVLGSKRTRGGVGRLKQAVREPRGLVRGGVGPLKLAVHRHASIHQDFKYNGGPLINQPQVYISYWGPKWFEALTPIPSSSESVYPNLSIRLNQFVQDMLMPPYIGTLGQYGVMPGTFVASSLVLTNVPTQIDESGIENIIQDLIDSGEIPEPPVSNNNIVLLIYLDDTIEVNQPDFRMCEPTNDNVFGFHSHFRTKKGNEFIYSVIPALDDTCIKNSCPGIEGDLYCSLKLAQTQEQRLTQMTSHEYAEMCTDPMHPTGWNGFYSDEIGDICNGDPVTISVGSNEWTVQRLYSYIDDRVSNGNVVCVFEPPIINMPAIAAIANNRYFFARTLDGRVFYKAFGFGQIGYAWREVNETGGRIGSAPVAAVSGNQDQVFVAAKGLDQKLYINYADLGGSFTSWTGLDFPTATDSAPALVGVGNNVVVFAKDLDGRVFKNLSDGQGWSEIEGGGRIGSAPAAGAVGNYVFVAAKGLDQNIYLNQGDPRGPFVGWGRMEGISTDVAPAVVGVGNSVVIFAKDLDGRVFHNDAVLGQSFQGWKEVEGGGRISSAPAAAAQWGILVTVAANGLDGAIYYNNAYLNQPFGGWFRLY